jgi:hypothetical protein
MKVHAGVTLLPLVLRMMVPMGVVTVFEASAQ